MITRTQLLAIMPRCPAAQVDAFLEALNAAMTEADISTPLRQAAFLAQLAHESGELRFWEEFADGKAYEGRRDLGNVHMGDGPRFKGRGPIQLTGRKNYRAAGGALGLPLEESPELAMATEVGFRVAAWFWRTRGLNEFADVGAFDVITRRINGGLNGREHRHLYYARAKKVLGATPPTPGAV